MAPPLPEYFHHSDEQLLTGYKTSGNQDLLGELYKRHMRQTYAVCLKYLSNADDAQDAAMNIYEKLVTLVRQHDINEFRAWVYSVARNYCLMVLRKNKKIVHLDIDAIKKPEYFMENSIELHPEDNMDKESLLTILENGLNSLSENQQLCLKKFYYEDKSYVEIVKLTGLNFNEVKSNIQNGKRNLTLWVQSEKK